jgi:murein endopeptidase
MQQGAAVHQAGLDRDIFAPIIEAIAAASHDA